MIGVGDGINAGVHWCVGFGFGTGFNGDVDGIKLWLDERIDLVFPEKYF